MKIGHSVSMCIKDIIEGNVAIDDVAKIVGNTAAPTQAAWDRVIDAYRKRYWTANPDEGERVCRQLLADGKIQQPRLRSPMYGRTATPLWEDVPVVSRSISDSRRALGGIPQPRYLCAACREHHLAIAMQQIGGTLACPVCGTAGQSPENLEN